MTSNQIPQPNTQPPLPANVLHLCEAFPDCVTLHGDWGEFYLGDTGDSSVGIPSYELTPLFETFEQLQEYVYSVEGRCRISERAEYEFCGEWDRELGWWQD